VSANLRLIFYVLMDMLFTLVSLQIKKAMTAKVDITHEASNEARIEQEKAFLGYGLIGTGTNNDVDCGPEIYTGFINPRVPTGQAVKKLYTSTDEGQRIMNLVPENALIIFTSKEFIKSESLTSDFSSAELVEWTGTWNLPRNKKKKVILANGLHRVTMMREYVVRQQITALRLARKRFKELADEDMDTDDAEQAIMNLRLRLRERSKWLVKFYDAGKSSDDMLF
jgi:hypothetical protein